MRRLSSSHLSFANIDSPYPHLSSGIGYLYFLARANGGEAWAVKNLGLLPGFHDAGFEQPVLSTGIEIRNGGFPPWLVQVEAKFVNQIAAHISSRRFPLWLAAC